MDLINTRIQAATPALTWRKSSFCGSAANCVEVASLPDGGIAMRDSKDPEGPTLVFEREQWTGFLRSALAGEFNALE